MRRGANAEPGSRQKTSPTEDTFLPNELISRRAKPAFGRKGVLRTFALLCLLVVASSSCGRPQAPPRRDSSQHARSRADSAAGELASDEPDYVGHDARGIPHYAERGFSA